MTLEDTMKKYAPAKDNNDPKRYAQFLATSLGIEPGDKVPADKIPLLASKIQQYESGGKYQAPTPATRTVTETTYDPMTGIPIVTNTKEVPSNEPPVAKPITTLEEYNAWKKASKPGWNPPPAIDQTKEVEGQVMARTPDATESQEVDASGNGLTPPQKAKYEGFGQQLGQDVGKIETNVKEIMASDAPPEEKENFLEKLFAGLYGQKDSLLNDRELARFAVLAAGGILSGFNTRASLRYAALDALKAGDTRASQEAAYRQATDTKAMEAKTKRGEMTFGYYKDSIKRAEDMGQVTPEVAQKLQRMAMEGKYTTIDEVLNSKGYGTAQYEAGLGKDAKQVFIKLPGYVNQQPAYFDMGKNEYVLFETKDGKTYTQRIPAAGIQQSDSTTNNEAAQERHIQDVLLRSDVFKTDPKTGKSLVFEMDKNTATSQIQAWQKNQRRLRLPDEVNMDAINNALELARQRGEKKPNLEKYLNLITVHSSTMADNTKMVDKEKKPINAGVLGSMVDDIKDANKGKTESETRRSTTAFMDRVAADYGSGDPKVTPESLASKVDRKNKYYNKIKEAPNTWWAYVYYSLATKKD